MEWLLAAWSVLGTVWRPLVAVLRLLGAVLGGLGPLLGGSWHDLRDCWVAFRRSAWSPSTLLGRSWAALGVVLRRF